MFFLARSMVCIGVVAFLLPGSREADQWRGLAEAARATATRQMQSLCSDAPVACAEAKAAQGMLSAGNLGIATAGVKKSVSTLVPADLLPAWSGPTHRS